MSNENQRRVDDAMYKMLEEVDKYCLRDLQKKSLKCAVVCCEDKNLSMTNVQNCIEDCNRPLKNVRTLVENEIQYLQKTLQGCLISCDSKIRDKGDYGRESYQGEFEGCAKKCIDIYINNLPDSLKRIKEMVKRDL